MADVSNLTALELLAAYRSRALSPVDVVTHRHQGIESRIEVTRAYTFLFNLTEQPASSIPCGRFSDGLPIGVQIVGERFDDAGVLAMSRFYETLRGPFQHPEMCLERSEKLR